MRTTFLIITLYLFSACTNNKDNLINTYDSLYEHLLQSDFEKIEPYLDNESLELVDKVTNAKNIDEMAAIGKAYNIRYFCAAYYANHNRFDGGERSLGNFLSYLSVTQISFFDFKFLFEPYKKKTKIGTENFLALAYNFYGDNKLAWARFSKNENEAFKLNLLYSLQQYESFYKEIYNSMRAELGPKDYEESFKFLYTYLPQRPRNNARDNSLFTEHKALRDAELIDELE